MKKLLKFGVVSLSLTSLGVASNNLTPVVSNGVLTFGQSTIARAAENETVNIILTETGWTTENKSVELGEYHYFDAIVGSTYNFTIHDHPGYRLNYWYINNNVGNDIGYGETTGPHSFVVPEEHGSYISIGALYEQIPPTGQTPPDAGNNNNVMPPNGGGEQTPPTNNDGGDTVSPDNNGGQATPDMGGNNDVTPPSNGGEQTPPKSDTNQLEGLIVLPELLKEDSKKDKVKKDLGQPKVKDSVANSEKPKVKESIIQPDKAKIQTSSGKLTNPQAQANAGGQATGGAKASESAKAKPSNPAPVSAPATQTAKLPATDEKTTALAQLGTGLLLAGLSIITKRRRFN